MLVVELDVVLFARKKMGLNFPEIQTTLKILITQSFPKRHFTSIKVFLPKFFKYVAQKTSAVSFLS